MFKKPNQNDLLSVAREVFLTDILPHVPQEKRYLAAMIGNAMGIAQRQETRSEENTEQALLQAIYHDDDNADWLQLANDFRSGRISERTHPELLENMMNAVRQELVVSNPKFLE